MLRTRNQTTMQAVMGGNRGILGFTLIELLVVVVIIAILAALAMVQFQIARIRANLARAQGDFKAMQLALNTYYIDNEVVPPTYQYDHIYKLHHNSTRHNLWPLSTPVAYLSSIPYEDPFNTNTPGNYVKVKGPHGQDLKLFKHYQYHLEGGRRSTDWIIFAQGPDQSWRGIKWGGDPKYKSFLQYLKEEPSLKYDPTNGLKSQGILWVDTDRVFETGRGK